MNKVVTFFRESGVARFFIPAGVFLIIFGVIVFIINTKNSNYVQTEAAISKVEVDEEAYTDSEGNHFEATYNVNVKYTVNGKEYEAELVGLSKYNVGDKMKIYYNPSDPSQITQTKSIILPIVIIVAGVAALVGGIVSGVNAIKRYKKMKKQEEGWNNG